MRKPGAGIVERGYFGSVQQGKMMIPTAVQFLRAFTIPRAMLRMFELNYPAWKARIVRGRSPWSPSVDHGESLVELEHQAESPAPSREKYLRPTWGVDPTAPEILGLARRLGAGQQSTRDFAESAFSFVKNHILWSMDWPIGGAVATLKAGYGTCLHKMSLLVALLRTNRIPARYRMLGVQIVKQIYDLQGVGEDPVGRAIYDSLGFVFGHGCVEMLLGDEWLPADVTWDEDLEAGMDIPISRLGMDPEGVWYFSVPEMTLRMEGLPFYLDLFGPTFPLMYRGMIDLIDKRFEEARKIGRERLQEIGRDHYIEQKKKFYVPILPPVGEGEQ